MPAVDRNLLRIAVYELLYGDEIDDAVAITEAVELAGRCRPTTRRASSTACSAASPTSPTTCVPPADAAACGRSWLPSTGAIRDPHGDRATPAAIDSIR